MAGRKKGHKKLLGVIMIMLLTGMSVALNLFAQSHREQLTRPKIDKSDWKYKLVNMDNPLEADYNVELGESRDGSFFDARAVGELEAMLDAGAKQGMDLAVVSGYRSYEYQKQLHERRIQRLVSEGYAYEQAVSTAPTIVARPGESEHNLGLAVDIVSRSYPILNSGFANTPEGRWLRENCGDFGFILRYEKEKQPITGVIYEPWHFRYVGSEAAAYIMETGLCLEEFLETA